MSGESGKLLFGLGASIAGLFLGVGAITHPIARDPEDFLPFMERVGVPAVLLLAAAFGLGFVAWKAVRIFAKPVRHWLEAQVQQSRVACETLPKIEQSLRDLVNATEVMPDRLDVIDSTLRDHTSKLDRLIDRR